VTEIIRLQPHDPLPDANAYTPPFGLVIRRFGEDDPNAVVTELDFFGRHPTMTLVAGEGGTSAPWEDVLHRARQEAENLGISKLYAVDRTAGGREQEVISHHGDHSVRSEELSDTDGEDGEKGSTILDRTTNAGFMR
jgi:hypothetical protein